MTNSSRPSPSSEWVPDEAVDRALARFTEAANSMVMCKRCNGEGYHHGFGEHGHSPDWCEACGGSQSVSEFSDREAMREAIRAALSSIFASQQ